VSFHTCRYWISQGIKTAA